MDPLQTYINQARSKGKKDKEIRTALIGIGWQAEVVDAALSGDVDLPPPPPPAPPAVSFPVTTKGQPSTSAWDAFQHILMFISMYVMATAIVGILHYFVDKWFPGVVSYDRSYSYADEWSKTLLRIYMAALIVSWPVFSLFFISIARKTGAHPEVRNLRSRKFLIYLTLVGTFLIMGFNVILTVYNFLDGNVTVNFLLHLLVTMSINGLIFGYYLHQVQDDRKIHA